MKLLIVIEEWSKLIMFTKRMRKIIFSGDIDCKVVQENVYHREKYSVV